MDSTALVRRLASAVYAPVFLTYLGLGILIVALPLYLTDINVGLRATSAVLAASGMGATIAGIPAGTMLSRVGEQRVVQASIVTVALAAALLGFTESALLLTVLMFFSGAALVGFLLSRQTLMTRSVVVTQRGRSMAYMGGTFRLSFLVGPLVAGFLIDQLDYRATFLIASACMVMSLVPLNRPHPPSLQPDTVASPEAAGVFETMRRYRSLMSVVGFAHLLIVLIREGRVVIMPLIGKDLGLTATQTGVLVAVSTAADLVLFPFAGFVMDRVGRLFTAIPAFSLFAVGFVILGLADSATAAVVGGAIIGIGNGLASGILLTQASDLAPPGAEAPFLAGLASVRNLGRVAGPILVGFVGAVVGLDGSAFVLAGVTVFAVAFTALALGETSRHPHALSQQQSPTD